MKNVKYVVEAGIMIALAFLLSKIDLFTMPQGGSVSPAAMLPIIFLAYRWGAPRGMLAGLVLGILKMFLGGYVVSPIQGILDYPLAYAMLGMAGLASSSMIKNTKKNNLREDTTKTLSWHIILFAGLCALLGAFLKYTFHVLSGIVFFREYATGNVLLYSMGYNSFVAVDFVISMILLVFIWKPLNKILPKA